MQRITRAIVLKQYSEDFELSEGPANLPLLQANQVLVRLEYASVSAADLRFLHGHCPVVRALPAVPGFEASGVVVETGGRLKNLRFQGKRVGVFTLDSGLPGTWAEYTVVQSRHCFLLNDTISFEQAAGMFQTPLTICMFEEVIGKSKGVIQTGGGSAVAKTLLRLCNYRALPCICVISSPDEAGSLTELGARYILLSSEADFETKAAKMCSELKITVGFDCEGGVVAGKVLNALQAGGVLYTYEDAVPAPAISNISPSTLIFDRKKVVGLNLFLWFESKHSLQKMHICDRIQQYYFMYRQEVMGTFPINEAEKALQMMREVGKKGKILLRLHVLPVPKQLLDAAGIVVGLEETKEASAAVKPALGVDKDHKNAKKAELKGSLSPSKAAITLEALLHDEDEVSMTSHDLSSPPNPSSHR